VWIATDIDGIVEARRTRLIGDRTEVRQRAAQAVLEMVRRRILFGTSEIEPTGTGIQR
jgi:nicotinamide mononucleotide (NMN) deamidase PncC